MSADALTLVATDGVIYGLLLFLIGAGLSMSMHAGRVLNLAHGSVVLAGAYLVWWAQATTMTAWNRRCGMRQPHTFDATSGDRSSTARDCAETATGTSRRANSRRLMIGIILAASDGVKYGRLQRIDLGPSPGI